MIYPRLYLGEQLKNVFPPMIETLSSPTSTSILQLLSYMTVGTIIFLIFGIIMAYLIDSSNNPQIRMFNRRQTVDLIRDVIHYRKPEERVAELEWYLDAFMVIRDDMVAKCKDAKSKELGGNTEKRELLRDIKEMFAARYADFV
jgi:hypothetical protein